MKKINLIILVCLTILLSSCTSIKMDSFQKGNSIYILNKNQNNEILAYDNVIINNRTFLPVEYSLYGLSDLENEPYLLSKGTIPLRSSNFLLVSELNINKLTLDKYNYLCINILNGVVKEYYISTEHDDIIIDIEQFGSINKIESASESEISEDMKKELENSFSSK